MKIINVNLIVKQDKIVAYEKLINQLVLASQAETGNIRYQHYKNLNNPNEYAIIEHWQDQAAIDAHNASEHFKEFIRQIDDYLMQAAEIIVLQN